MFFSRSTLAARGFFRSSAQKKAASSRRALGWPARTQADIANAWRRIRSQVTSWRDLDPALMTEVEKLIDFVTADHADTLEP